MRALFSAVRVAICESVFLRQNHRQQAWKSTVQLISAQRVHVSRSNALGPDKAGIAQHPKMMGHARFGSSSVQFATRGFADPAKVPNNFKANRIAQGIKDPFEDKITG